jgi:hypothetical protein
MYNLSDAAIPSIAGDVRNVLNATDTALSMQAAMLSTVIEAVRTSDVPVNASQKVYDEVVGAMSSMLEARAKTRNSISTMTAIGRQSAQREMMDGCPMGWPNSELAEPTKVTA